MTNVGDQIIVPDEVVILQMVRQSHENLQAHLQGADEGWVPWDWVEQSVLELSDRMYASMPHWHMWDGQCIEPVPFELRMAALAIWASVWYYDIMLRKARDRDSPLAHERTEEWRRLLEKALDYTRQDVATSRDLDAEARHQRNGRQLNRVKHWWNRRMWGH